MDATVGNRVGVSFSGSRHSCYEDENALVHLLRQAVYAAGYGDKDSSAPFTGIIEQGMTVLLKPNWVFHENYSGQGNDCLVTHPNFIVAVLEEVLKAKPCA